MGGLYSLDTSAAQNQSDTALVADLQLWHERLGHVHMAGIEQMGRGKVVEGLVIAPDRSEPRICEGSVMGKMHRTPIPRECSNRAAGLLDLIHTDVAGPLPVMSKGGAR